ncbi:type I restriction endonuclease subunit R [Clostridium sp. 'deep sea']|uniref:type I restriction endonuclease subunit R n=1 Tax=Clostridium sp. 'deep sea' TaxID=2779445 RepID=UPI0018965C87|nr:type I restriction endonuclease [Clostridium sp. 'deep sea']QOR35757.1 type I restriction endonuclease subunit R [Clostridium sp. 'deep sea']
MISNITPENLKERPFQTIIKEYLLNSGYSESFNKDYDKLFAIDKKCLFSFLETTQPKELKRLKEIYKDNYHSKVINNIHRELKTRGVIDVLKHGLKDFGVKLKLVYFKPPTNLNPNQFTLYQQNILSITEELNYIDKKRIDLVIFLNGIPIITMELKNSFTGQSYKNAITQYKTDRSNKEQLFKFKERTIVNFAVDTNEVYMTTKLSGQQTYFLPFNKGIGDGAGNPQVEGKLNTHYLWEEVLQKDSILEILHKFVYIDKKEKTLNNGDKIMTEKVIFPRYHQLNVVRNIIKHVKEYGSGQKYLIQHSAGSGKTNSITWLSHRLASLHNDNNDIIFNGVIVVTDRRVLDKQLQDSIYQLEHKLGVVAKIDKDSNQLVTELEKGTKIIISTIQKFPHILKKLEGTKGKKYAIVIDEAHSSTSGKNIIALKESLTLEQATKLASKEEQEHKDKEDLINEQLERFVDNSHVSFFGFTATPKSTTLRLFGNRREDGKYYPFHSYSMKQAIEEGFILDVLQNYMTYSMYYNVIKKIDTDPAFDKAKATRSIVRYVSLHPHNISQKTEIMIEHFRNSIMPKIGGQAKAMLVTSSRLHAVRYKLAFDDYLKRKKYTDVKTLAAFSGTVKDDEIDYTESNMNNGIADSKLPEHFDEKDIKILIVANKYQTGFDQPKLHTMYVDKKLAGVKAVQTLSRLNRTYAGKEDTFVLDFVNEPEDIKQSFLPFYKVSTLNNDIDPNEIYTLEHEIYSKQVIDKKDVVLFTDFTFQDKHTVKEKAIMNNCVDYAIERLKDFNKEQKLEFRNLLKQFVSFYNLIIQIAPIVDADLHRLSIYARYVIKKIDIESPGNVDITDKVVLQYYKLKKKTEGKISLQSDDDNGLEIQVGNIGMVAEPEADLLSNIIKKLNERYGTDFSNSAKLSIGQIKSNLLSNEDLELKSKVNTYDLFKLAFEKSFMDGVVEEYDKNQSFYGRVLKDKEFRGTLMDLLMFEVYDAFKKKHSA